MISGQVYDRLRELLLEKGYAVHNGFDDARPELGSRAWWFTWGAPTMSSYEVGETCGNAVDAWASAMEHWFKNAEIPLYPHAGRELNPEG